LAADGTQTLSSSIDTSTLSVGEHTLYVMADYWNNLVGESNEANNLLSVTFNVTEPVPPDLAVTSITAATAVVQGDTLDFSYVIENISAGLPAGMSWAGFRIDSQPAQSPAAGFNQTNSLAAGGTQTLSNSIDTSTLSVGEHTLYVMADYWNNLVTEGNEANNLREFTFTVTQDLFT
jgi:subtilase family serine protease